MIRFNFIDVEINFDHSKYVEWLQLVSKLEGKRIGEITYVFCSDDYLLEMNQRYLNHDTYTDIITFDNSIGNTISGDIYISVDRLAENALVYKVSLLEELMRVVVHGVLHLCGYKDKSSREADLMRSKEDQMIALFHVEQSNHS